MKDEEMDWNTLDDDDDSDSEGCFQDANEFQVMPDDFYWAQKQHHDKDLLIRKDQPKRQARPSYYDYESTIRDHDEPMISPASFEEEEEEADDATTGPAPVEVATGLFLQPQPLEITSADSWKTVMGNIEHRLTDLLDNLMNRNDGIENYVNWCERRRRFQTADMEAAAVAARDAEFAANHQEAKIDGDPRTYQRQLLERAKQGNVIVHLGTGYGKTLIALLLIKHVHDHPTGTSTTGTTDTSAQRRKKTIVLVPSVALALQHSTTLRANLPYTVATACFETSNNTDAYRKELAAADILVATQGALWDLLLHYQDLVSLDRYALLVVDECHYCAGRHAYRLIFQKFYHTLPLTERPHILGLTASPIINLRERHTEEDLELMVQTLQTTMDAVLVSMDPADDVYTHSQTIVEEEIPYQSLGMARSLPSADNLLLHPSRYRELRQLEALYHQVGPLVVSLYCQVLQRELSRNEFEEESPAEFEAVLGHLRSVVQWCEQESRTLGNQGRTDKLLALESVLERELSANPTERVGLVFCHRRITAVALHHYFSWRENHKGRFGEQYGWGQSGDRRRWCQQKDMIPRVEYVADDEDMFADARDDPFLAFNNGGEASGDVDSNLRNASSEDLFINGDDDIDMGVSGEMNDVGPSKACISSAASWMKTQIRSTVLVRNVTTIFNSLSIDHREVSQVDKRQWLHVDHRVRDVLTKLRRKELNLLFATCKCSLIVILADVRDCLRIRLLHVLAVVEEGVDVQACSVVVAFDSIRSTKSYVQMKGRARKRKATFFVFQDSAEIPGKATVSLESARNMEARLRGFIASKALSEVASTDGNTIANDATDYELPPTLEPELSAVRNGFYKGNHGTVDLQSAKGLITRYCLSVALDPHARFSRDALVAYMPDFRENMLVLPSHLPSSIRVVILPSQCHDKPKRDKQKILSLMACVRLHCHALLNDRLLPLSKADIHRHILRATKAEFPAIRMPVLPLELFFDVHRARREIFVRTISCHGEGFFHAQQQLKGEGHQLALVTVTDSFSDLPSFFVDHKEFGQVETQYSNAIPATCDEDHFGMLREFFILLMDERWRRSSRHMYFKNRGKVEYDSVLMPYVVGLVGRDGELDWDFMKRILMESQRTEREREAAVTCLSIEEGLVAPRLWNSTIDDHTKYIAYGPSDETVSARFPVEKEGIYTYKDYFEKVRGAVVASDIQLFDVQRYWALPNSFSSLSFSEPKHEYVIKVVDSKYPMCKQLSAIKIPQSVVREPRIANAHVGLLSCLLPQGLFVYERCVTTKAFIDFCEINLPKLGSYLNRLPLETVAAAMTSKSCGMDVSYERLEWLGDAVLKMIQTESLLKSIDLKDWIQFLNEGDLSMFRQGKAIGRFLNEVYWRVAHSTRFS
jgi:dsRNA-specific ribonuclease